MNRNEADLACLRAASPRGLVRNQACEMACPGSAHPNVGWWARASWDNRHADKSKGGPWTVERVYDLCERGLLGTGVAEQQYAEITKAGRAYLRAGGPRHEVEVSIDLRPTLAGLRDQIDDNPTPTGDVHDR